MRQRLRTWLVYTAWLWIIWMLGPLVFGFDRHATLSFFDAEHYLTIAEQGYGKWLTAFYPGFPLFWKAVNTVWWVGAVHALLAGTALTGLAQAWNMNRWEQMLLGTAPLAVFWVLPYSEALCLLGLSAAMIGVKMGRPHMLGAGMVLACICRPLWPVLLVALLLLEFLPAWRTGSGMGPKRWLGLAGVTAGTVAALSIHALHTGEWFTFHQAQAHWGNALGWPRLPFSTWSDAPVMMIDSAALMVGMMAFTRILAVRFGGSTSPATMLGLYYLAGMVFLTLMFRGGALFSLGRFIWAMPFAGVLLIELGRAEISWQRHRVYLLWIPVCALSCGAYLHVRSLLIFLPVAVLGALVFWWSAQPEKRSWHHAALLVACIGVQLLFAVRVWSGNWAG